MVGNNSEVVNLLLSSDLSTWREDELSVKLVGMEDVPVVWPCWTGLSCAAPNELLEMIY